MTGDPDEHIPVLVKEVVQFLNPKPGQVIVDATLGRGGHSIEILKLLGGEGLLIGVDKDLLTLGKARRRIERRLSVPAPIKLIEGNFADLSTIVKHTSCSPPSGILLDLGLSSPQLSDSRLGLSWDSDEALDMRLDRNGEPPSAADIVNEWTEEELTRLFREKGEERWAKRIALRIGEARRDEPILTGRRLGEIVSAAIPRKAWPPKIHPATRVFMALRIEVNQELENLDAVLPAALELLAPGGRLVVISFHSLEDRRVKRFMRAMAKPEGEAPWPHPQAGAEGKARIKILTRRPIGPGPEEIKANPRSRSAKLRAAEKN